MKKLIRNLNLKKLSFCYLNFLPLLMDQQEQLLPLWMLWKNLQRYSSFSFSVPISTKAEFILIDVCNTKSYIYLIVETYHISRVWAATSKESLLIFIIILITVFIVSGNYVNFSSCWSCRSCRWRRVCSCRRSFITPNLIIKKRGYIFTSSICPYLQIFYSIAET